MCCRKLSPALLREGLSLFLCVPIMSQVLRIQHDASMFNTGQGCHMLVDTAQCPSLC